MVRGDRWRSLGRRAPCGLSAPGRPRGAGACEGREGGAGGRKRRGPGGRNALACRGPRVACEGIQDGEGVGAPGGDENLLEGGLAGVAGAGAGPPAGGHPATAREAGAVGGSVPVSVGGRPALVVTARRPARAADQVGRGPGRGEAHPPGGRAKRAGSGRAGGPAPPTGPDCLFTCGRDAQASVGSPRSGKHDPAPSAPPQGAWPASLQEGAGARRAAPADGRHLAPVPTAHAHRAHPNASRLLSGSPPPPPPPPPRDRRQHAQATSTGERFRPDCRPPPSGRPLESPAQGPVNPPRFSQVRSRSSWVRSRPYI